MSESAEWKTKYKAQTEWRKRNHYKQFSFQLYECQIATIRQAAKEHQMPIAKFICSALEAQYQINLSKSEWSDSQEKTTNPPSEEPTFNTKSENTID